MTYEYQALLRIDNVSLFVTVILDKLGTSSLSFSIVGNWTESVFRRDCFAKYSLSKDVLCSLSVAVSPLAISSGGMLRSFLLPIVDFNIW